MSRVGGERGFVTVDGRRVLVSRYRRGPAFIVIHGLSRLLARWRPSAKPSLRAA